MLAIAKEKREAIERERKQKIKEREERLKKKMVAENDALEKAKAVLSKYGGNPRLCEKKLSCNDLVLLLRDMGFNDEAHSRGGKRLLQQDLRSLFWHKYNHVPQRTATTGNNADPATTGNNADPDEWEEDSQIPVWEGSDEEPIDPRQSESVPFTIGARVKVFWPGAKAWYKGVIDDVDQCDSTFKVHYPHDDESLWHDMSWKVKLLQ